MGFHLIGPLPCRGCIDDTLGTVTVAEVVVVVAHPDDETLGCGATLARLAMQGHRIHLLVVADGETGRPGVGDEEVSTRQASARAAAAVLGIEPPTFLELPDQGLETLARIDITRAIEGFSSTVSPDLVLTHDGGDLNLDHRVVHDATMTAFRPLPNTSWTTVCTFETPSASDYGALAHGHPFLPTLFVDVVDHLDTKLEALDCYPSEHRPPPHPRSPEVVRAQAALRGAQCGMHAAEAFHLIYGRGPNPLTS